MIPSTIVLFSPTVRTILLPILPAGYMDICMSTKLQEISTLLLASMYLHGYKKTDDLDLAMRHTEQVLDLFILAQVHSTSQRPCPSSCTS